jgi:hypothetical protein
MLMLMTNCEGCGTPFPWERHKKYCSVQCRKEHAWSKKKKSDTEVWQTADEFAYPESLRGEHVDPAERFQKVISIFANTGTHYYRLACPRNGAVAPYTLRWFPVLAGARSFLRANPFQRPDDMPLPGLYLLAVFSEEKKLIEPPRWKLYVPSFDPQARWHIGTTKP